MMVETKTMLRLWVASLFLYPLAFKFINSHIHHWGGLITGILYGVMNAYLYYYAFRQWYVGFKEQEANQKQALFFLLIVLNGFVILGFITSLVFRLTHL